MGMKEEYASQECSICGSQADGLHYGAISCRSCNAFFRRTVVEKSNYRCKYHNTCQIDIEARCSCRACRFQKCIEAGMKISAVQPRRDPTGSQKERRKRQAEASLSDGSSDANPSPAVEKTGSILIDAIRTDYDFANGEKNAEDKSKVMIKKEVDEEMQPCTSQLAGDSKLSQMDDDEQQEFQLLVYAFKEHQRMMQLSFTTCEGFLDELQSGPKLRMMDPTDVNKLSAVELTGLLYWIEKMKPFRELPTEDRGNLLKRYSVRKLSLDHFYSASKHPKYAERDEFVMNNYTYVGSDKTGFELPEDDEKQIEAKRHTFAPTFKRFWNNVIRPFVDLEVCDAEIVYLHVMLLWSQSNHEHVSEFTRKIMKERRDWAMKRLFEWYLEQGFPDSDVRFGQMTLLLGEIETICELHCQDFQVAKLFEFCDMSDFWYETLCYAPCNTNSVNFDPDLLDNLKKFTAIGFLEKTCDALMTQQAKKAIAEGTPSTVQKAQSSSAMHTLEQSFLTNGYIPAPTEVLPRDQKPLIPDLQQMTIDFTGAIKLMRPEPLVQIHESPPAMIQQFVAPQLPALLPATMAHILSPQLTHRTVLDSSMPFQPNFTINFHQNQLSHQTPLSRPPPPNYNTTEEYQKQFLGQLHRQRT